jgi:hypothetical protein
MLYLREERNTCVKGFNFATIGDYFNRFYSENLPFELTEAQKKVIREIRKDMGSGKQMNRKRLPETLARSPPRFSTPTIPFPSISLWQGSHVPQLPYASRSPNFLS